MNELLLFHDVLKSPKPLRTEMRRVADKVEKKIIMEMTGFAYQMEKGVSTLTASSVLVAIR
jgi:hypothetical protein